MDEHNTNDKTGKVTTAELSRLKEQKKAKAVFSIMLFGMACTLVGLLMHFVPLAVAADENRVWMDDTVPQNTGFDLQIPPAEEMAYYTEDGEQEWAASFSGAFNELTEDEALSRTAHSLNLTPQEEEGNGTTPYVKNELLVTMAVGTKDEDIQRLMDKTGGYVIDTLAEGDEIVGPILLVSTEGSESMQAVKQQFLADTMVLSCELNYSVEPADDPVVSNFDDADSFGDAVELGDTEDDEYARQLMEVTDTGKTIEEFDAEYDTPEGERGGTGNETPVSAESLFAESTSVNDRFNAERWDYKHLRCEEAWRYQKTNAKLTVAVVDGTMNVNHNDLKGVIVSPYHAAQNNATIPAPGDYAKTDGDHGTHVMGIIGAQANNGIGIAGLSYNACIMPVYCGAPDPENDNRITMYVSDIIKGLNYVYQHAEDPGQPPVRVVNLSLGALVESNSEDATKRRDAYGAVFAKLARKHILVVAAAGNQGSNDPKKEHLPAGLSKSYDNVIAVMNLKESGNTVVRASSSNYNPAGTAKDKFLYQVGAPGTDILSCYSYDEAHDNKVNNAIYHRLSGTSMAAPQVSGLAALIFSANKNLTPKQVRKIICETATDLGPKGPDPEYGYGEINPVAALKKVTGQNYDNNGETKEQLLKNIKLTVDGKAINGFDPLKTTTTMRIEYSQPVTKERAPSFKWSYPTDKMTMTETHNGKKAQNNGTPRKLDDGRKVIDYTDAYRFTFRKKGETDALKAYAFEYVTHVLVSEAAKPSNPSNPPEVTPAPANPSPAVPGEISDPTNPPQAPDPAAPNDPSTPVTPELPHAKLTMEWYDAKSKANNYYKTSSDYLDLIQFDNEPAKTDKNISVTMSYRVSGMPNKSRPTQSIVDEFFNSVVPTVDETPAKAATSGSETGSEKEPSQEKAGTIKLPASIKDEKTGKQWPVKLVSSKMGTERTLPSLNGDQPVQYRTCQLKIGDDTTGTTVTLDIVFWISNEDISQATGGASNLTAMADIIESLSWANNKMTMKTSDGQELMAYATGNPPMLETESTKVAEDGIVSIEEPFTLGNDGCKLKEKNLNKIVTQGAESVRINEYVYTLTPSYTRATVSDKEKADATPKNERDLSTSFDVTLYAKAEDDIGNDMGSIPGPSAPTESDIFKELSNLEVWVGGTKYKEFSYDKTDYVIPFDTASPLPGAPEVKNVPEDLGWKLDTITSEPVGDENGSMRHTVTIRNPEKEVSRQYVFTYERETPERREVYVPEGANLQGSQSRRNLAATGGDAPSRLVQTGDAIVIGGGMAITLGAVAWLVAYKLRSRA